MFGSRLDPIRRDGTKRDGIRRHSTRHNLAGCDMTLLDTTCEVYREEEPYNIPP